MLDLIESGFDALSPELQRAARWVQAHPADVGLRSMRECARRAQVAPATMTRLAQALGLEGFEALREPVRERLAQGDNYVAKARSLQRGRGRRPDWLSELNQRQQANVAPATDAARPAIEAAAKALLASRRVAFLGLRASYGIAWQLHYSYQLLAANGALLGDLGGTLQDQLDQIAPGDEMLVAVSLSPYTRRTVQAVEQCAGRGVSVLALTDSALSPIARPAAQSLLFRAESSSFFHSMVGALALVEALVAAVAACGGRKVMHRLQTIQRRLDEQGAYWERLPNRMPA